MEISIGSLSLYTKECHLNYKINKFFSMTRAIFHRKKKNLDVSQSPRCLLYERKCIIIDPKLLKSFSKIELVHVSRTGIIFGNNFVHKL